MTKVFGAFVSTVPLVLAGVLLTATAPAASASPADRVCGVVEQVPDTADQTGIWRIGPHAVWVDGSTRLKSRARFRSAGDYWTQAATGVVVRAPSWAPADAHAAGFRPALAAEVTAVGLGRYVEVEGTRRDDGTVHAVEIELQHSR